MRNAAILFASMMLALVLSACQSKHEEGVTSSYRSQWTSVSADTKATTDAAEAVLEEEGLKDVEASSTNVDGVATGMKANGAKVKVAIRKQGADSSQVSVSVGKLGDPSVGAEIAKKIKSRAEGDAKTAM